MPKTIETTRKLNKTQLNSFYQLSRYFNSLPTLPMPGTYLSELKDCGINEREATRNILIGYILTKPSGSQLCIETDFFDTKDSRYDADLHIVNFIDEKITSYHKGWGTWSQYYGDGHHADKSFLLTGGTVTEIKI